MKGNNSNAKDRSEADETVCNGRESNGRFGAGNNFSKGRKRQEHFRGLFERCVTDHDFEAVVKSLVNQAIGGDVQAARLILERCLGREVEKVEVENEPNGRVVLYLPDNGRQPSFESVPTLRGSQAVSD